MSNSFDGKRPEAVNAMRALFEFCEAMEAQVSVAELSEVMRLAISDGHDSMLICLEMAKMALNLAADDGTPR